MKKYFKDLLKENGILAIIFGIVAAIWVMPLVFAFTLVKFLIEKPIIFIMNKIKRTKPKPKPRPKPKPKPRKKKY